MLLYVLIINTYLFWTSIDTCLERLYYSRDSTADSGNNSTIPPSFITGMSKLWLLIEMYVIVKEWNKNDCGILFEWNVIERRQGKAQEDTVKYRGICDYLSTHLPWSGVGKMGGCRREKGKNLIRIIFPPP